MASMAPDEIHLWLVNEAEVAEPLLAQYRQLLSEDEALRHERLRIPADRRRFLITRAAIRTLLSDHVPAVPPTRWRFSRNEHGRPEVAEPRHENVPEFNISHTNGMIVIALTHGGEVGVDVEYTGRLCRTVDVADRYFAVRETASLLALPESEQRARFFDLWTLKEAYIKACGMGLAIPLRSFSFELARESITLALAPERNDDPGRWQFWQLRPSAEHQIALAYAGESQQQMKLLGGNLIPMVGKERTQLSVLRSSQRMYSRTILEP